MSNQVTLNAPGRALDACGKGSTVVGGFVAALATACAILILFCIVGAYFVTAVKLTTSVSKAGIHLFLAIAKWSGVTVGSALALGLIGYIIRLVATKCCSNQA